MGLRKISLVKCVCLYVCVRARACVCVFCVLPACPPPPPPPPPLNSLGRATANGVGGGLFLSRSVYKTLQELSKLALIIWFLLSFLPFTTSCTPSANIPSIVAIVPYYIIPYILNPKTLNPQTPNPNYYREPRSPGCSVCKMLAVHTGSLFVGMLKERHGT